MPAIWRQAAAQGSIPGLVDNVSASARFRSLDPTERRAVQCAKDHPTRAPPRASPSNRSQNLRCRPHGTWSTTAHQGLAGTNACICRSPRGHDRSDEGKSGLNIDGRRSMQQLIEDVQKKETDFTTILAYDVSRWGRFPLPNNGLSAMPAVRATRTPGWRHQRKAAGHGRHGHGIAALGGFTVPAWRGS